MYLKVTRSRSPGAAKAVYFPYFSVFLRIYFRKTQTSLGIFVSVLRYWMFNSVDILPLHIEMAPRKEKAERTVADQGRLNSSYLCCFDADLPGNVGSAMIINYLSAIEI